MSIASSAGPIYNPRLPVSNSLDGEPQLEFQVFFCSICKEASTPEVADAHLRSMLPGSGYTLCPGIPSFCTEVSLTSIRSGSHRLCAMIVRAVSFGMLQIIARDLLRNHSMTAS